MHDDLPPHCGPSRPRMIFVMEVLVLLALALAFVVVIVVGLLITPPA